MANVLLHQGCDRITGDPRRNGAWNLALGHDADCGMETPHQFVVLPREEALSDVLWAERPSPAHRTVECPEPR